ncbi:MAG: hypothetical protein LQ342_004745 [Letrouitia transgressa]|nr:MAG: hypothetical protein LQ342_004745 [Letrouitia transgressa]
MLEWARDVYRQEILQSLYELAQANKMALSPSIHSNIYSLSGTPEIKKAGISNPSLEHDSPTILITEDNCVFRNMSWMDQIISASQTSQIPSGGSHQLLSVGSGFPTQSQFNSGGQPLQIISRSVRFLVTEENIGYYFRTLDETLQASNFPAEVLDRHRKQVLGNIIEGLLHLGVPAITVSGQELYDIENAWTGQPNADVLGNSNDLFFFSCRVAYTMEESSKLLRDLYMIAVKPDAFKLLQIALLRLGRVSTELHTLTRNIVGEYTAIPPGSCTFAVQTLRDFSSQENITLASVSTSFSLTYTMGSEGQQIAFPIWTIEGPKQEWFLEWFKNLRGLNFHHPSFLSVSEQVDLLPLTV